MAAGPTPSRVRVLVAKRQRRVKLSATTIRQALGLVCTRAGLATGEISVALVDDPTIAELHQRFLQLPDPTDVLSFVWERTADRVEGEIVASADTARRMALELGWPAEYELLLYVIHGGLHLVGYDDLTPRDRRTMRQAEREVLSTLGLTPPAPPKPLRPARRPSLAQGPRSGARRHG